MLFAGRNAWYWDFLNWPFSGLSSNKKRAALASCSPSYLSSQMAAESVINVLSGVELIVAA